MRRLPLGRHLRGLLATLLLAVVLPAAADDFLPPGALDYEEETLPNGMRLVIQRVHSAPYVSARLVIRTGTDHFPCDDRELPHLIEHLLFSANARHDEDEIDEAVGVRGGAINAYTYPEQTDVVLDMHSRFQVDAVELLASMVADFAPEEADVAREADVVERESGFDHTPLRMWWSRQEATQVASTKFALAAGLLCSPGLTPVHHLRLADVTRAFRGAYVPPNMILVLVGDLDEAGVAAARTAFGARPPAPRPVAREPAFSMPSQDSFNSGWLSGTSNLDKPTALALAPFRDWQGYYTLLLAESWLNERMFRELRSERGIAYTPSAQVNYHGSALSISLAVETEPSDTAFTLGYLRDLAGEVHAHGIPPDDFERLRRGTLLGMAQQFERISDRADYLSDSMREIDEGRLFDSEAFYQQLDYATFSRLLARDWPARFAVMDDSPRIPWAMRAALLAGSVALLVLALGWRLWRRFREVRPG